MGSTGDPEARAYTETVKVNKDAEKGSEKSPEKGSERGSERAIEKGEITTGAGWPFPHARASRGEPRKIEEAGI